MNKHYLPKTININGVQCVIKSDYRDVLYLFEILHDPDLLPSEAIYLAVDNFYVGEEYKDNLQLAAEEMFNFIACGDSDTNSSGNNSKEQLYDWDKDFNIIVAPINRILGYDVRGIEYLHWWTFMSAFMEIGECTFSTYIGIRKKLNRGIKLEKYEEKIFKEHRNEIIIPKKYDRGTQELIDEILG